jgi:hypothetical protein
MDRRPETERGGGVGIAIPARGSLTSPVRAETAPSPCRWPTLAMVNSAMGDVDAALAADPLFHRCLDGSRRRIDVRYGYLRPLEFSCRHCAEGGGVCVVGPETVVCRHRMTHRKRHPALEG